ncbi:MAG: alpha/beta fold hydrolase, partial [Betaproteobacteria bacterium]
MPEGHAAFAGRRIWYRDSGGNGVPVVFLHAGTGSSLVWELQVPAFTAVGHRFIAYDRLGHGRSVLEPGAQPGTAADDLEGLARHLQLDRFHLVGTAAGGIVALDY